MIYGRYSEFEAVQENASSLENTYGFEGTLAEMQTVLVESAREMCEIQTAMLVADIVIEESLLESASVSEAEVLLENVITDGLEKLKKVFIKLRDKIVAWFNKAVASLKLFFTSGEKFVTQYADQIRAKISTVKDFSYEGFEFDINAGFALSKDYSGKLSDMVAEVSKETGAQLTKNLASLKEAPKPVDYKEAINTKFGVKSVGEVTTKLKNAFQPSKEKTTIKNANFAEMLSVLQSKDKFIKEVETIRDDAKQSIAEMIDMIDTAQRLAEGEKDSNKSAIGAFVSQAASKGRTLVSLNNSIAATTITMIKTISKNYEGVLKSLLRKGKDGKAEKPGATKMIGSGGQENTKGLPAGSVKESLLESIMRGL